MNCDIWTESGKICNYSEKELRHRRYKVSIANWRTFVSTHNSSLLEFRLKHSDFTHLICITKFSFHFECTISNSFTECNNCFVWIFNIFVMVSFSFYFAERSIRLALVRWISECLFPIVVRTELFEYFIKFIATFVWSMCEIWTETVEYILLILNDCIKCILPNN